MPNTIEKSERQVLAVLNSKPGMKFIEADKQMFTEALAALHNEGKYAAYSPKQNKFIISSKNPKTLEHQKHHFNQVIDDLFERV